MRRLRPAEVGWRLGDAHEPRGGQLWVPWDRTAGVIGPQGSGKTLDLLAPALIDAPGAALITLTKADDLLLTFTARSREGRPCVVLDPFGLVPGLPEVVWDPIRGCVDPLVAERRAKAFTAGTVKGAVAGGHTDDAARFYAAEAAKVLQGYFHAAALTGRTLEHLLAWVAKPRSSIGTDRDPAGTPARRVVLGRAAARGAARRRPHRRQHHHHRPAGHVAVLPGGHPPPVRARAGPAGHRHRRGDPPPGNDLPARAGGPLRVRVAVDDRVRRTRPRHGPRRSEHLPVGTAVPTVPRDPRRAALHRAAAEPANPDGQRTGAGDLVHVGRPSLARSCR